MKSEPHRVCHRGTWGLGYLHPLKNEDTGVFLKKANQEVMMLG